MCATLEKAIKNQMDPSLKKLMQADLGILKSMVDEDTMLTPLNADDLIRDPTKYSDKKAAEASRPRIDGQQVETSMRALLNLR